VGYSQLQGRRFARAYKKMRGNELTALHAAMDLVIDDPKLGNQKIGDLKGIYVYKFRSGQSEFHLAYCVNQRRNVLTWEALGPHENFYRELKSGN